MLRSGTYSRAAIAFMVASVGLLGTARADQLVMKNGDRVTGSIIKQDGKTITVKTDNFGTVTAPWDQVASVTSSNPVTVVLKDGRTVMGAMTSTEQKLEVKTPQTTVETNLGDVAAIRNPEEQTAYERLQNPGLLQLWAGNASLGWAGTNGNAKTLTFTMAADAARLTNTDKTSIYFNLIKASALVNGQNASTAQAVRGGVAYNHNVSKRLFVNVVQRLRVRQVQESGSAVCDWRRFWIHAVRRPIEANGTSWQALIITTPVSPAA